MYISYVTVGFCKNGAFQIFLIQHGQHAFQNLLAKQHEKVNHVGLVLPSRVVLLANFEMHVDHVGLGIQIIAKNDTSLQKPKNNELQ